MPRAFLLRRTVNSQSDEARMQGYKNNLTIPGEAKRNGFKRTYGGNKNKFIWTNEQNKMDMMKGPYTYQSYIEGDMIKRKDALTKTDHLFSTPRTNKDDAVINSQPKEQDEKIEVNTEISAQPQEMIATAPGSKPVYRCEQCGKTFKTKYTLTIHLKMPNHTGARPFVCNICGKGFRLSSTLCRHKIIHTSDKPHKCHICQKAFNRSSTLKTHIRTHSEKKEFMCDVCGKGFHQKGNLRNHFLIHTGEKPYNCRLCNKAFNKLSNLKFHLHVHTDNTPYRCRYCKTAFSRRCDLRQHIQNTHGEQHSDQFDSDEN